MGVFGNLINRLHRVFNKDPQNVPIVNIACNIMAMELAVGEHEIVVSIQGRITTIQLNDTTTVIDVINSLQSIDGVTAYSTNLLYNNMLAKGFYPDNYSSQNITLQYPASLLWTELKTYGFVLHDQNNRILAAEKELYANTADGEWLEYWLNTYFGIHRYDDETDAAYFNRAKYEILSIKVNNKALMQLVKDAAGLTVDIKDLSVTSLFMSNEPGSRTNFPEDMLFNNATAQTANNLFGVYIYNGNINNLTPLQKTTVVNTINRYRAAGTFPVYFAPLQWMETNVPTCLMNDKGYVVGPKPAGWEQVIVT